MSRDVNVVGLHNIHGIRRIAFTEDHYRLELIIRLVKRDILMTSTLILQSIQAYICCCDSSAKSVTVLFH